MGRGQYTLFDSFFTKPTPPAEKKARKTPDFHQMLAYRYYYYAEIKLLRYDVCLDELAQENFRSPETIIDILSEARAVVSTVVDSRPTLKELRAKYPWLVWEI